MNTAVMTTGRVLRAYITESKYESLRMLRAPAFAGPFLLLPVALYLLFGVVLFGAEISKDPAAGIFTFLGFSVLGVMGPGMFGFGISLATEREQGLLKLKRALPMPAGAALLGKVLMSMVFVAIVMATMMLAAPLGHLKLAAWQMAALGAVAIAGSTPFCALGLFIGSVASVKSSPAIVNLFYLPMLYLSGILFPLPASLKWIALASPAYHLSQAARAAMGVASEGYPAAHLAVLAAVTLVFSAMAMRRLERAG
jgi:ABC-2 type transport system permease protein